MKTLKTMLLTAAVLAVVVTPAMAADMKSTGIGVNRIEAARTFTAGGYRFYVGADPDNWTAKGRKSVVTLSGPEENLKEMGFLVGGELDNREVATVVANMTAMLDLAFPAWDERGKWLARAIQAGGGMVSRNGVVAKLSKIEGFGILFAITPEH